jgi:hypothetical protein
MEWNLEGKRVKVNYMGYIRAGKVINSRVKYGGDVQHAVDLVEPIQLPWRTEPTLRVLVDHNEVVDLLV